MSETQAVGGAATLTRARVEVLDELLAQIDQVVGADAELVGVDLRRVAGMQQVKQLVVDELARARQRVAWDAAVDRLAAGSPVEVPHRRPTVLDPGALGPVRAPQGQLLTPVVTRPATATSGLSSAQVWMPPGHASRAHVHDATDVIVVVLYGRATTVWWDPDGRLHELDQRAGQHLHIPCGVPHAAVNWHGQPVIALEVRNCARFGADNVLLPHLQPVVDDLVAARQATPGVAA